jgi:hypothetical protein
MFCGGVLITKGINIGRVVSVSKQIWISFIVSLTRLIRERANSVVVGPPLVRLPTRVRTLGLA